MPFPLIAAGLIAGVAGSAMQGQAAKSASKSQIAAEERARQQTQEAILRSQANIAGLLRGYNPETRKYLMGILGGEGDTLFGREATAGTALSDQETRNLQDLESRLTETPARMGFQNGRRVVTAFADTDEGQEIKNQIAALKLKAGGDPGTAGLLGRDEFDAIGGRGLLGDYEAIGSDASGRHAGILSDFDTETGRLGTDWMGLEREARKLGKGQHDRIDREAQEAITAANRMSGAALRSRGLGESSIVGNQMGSNTRQGLLGALDRKNAVDDMVTGRVLSLGEQRIGMQAGRGAQRTGLQLSANDQMTNLGMLPLQLQERLLAGNPFNAATGVNYSAFNSGASPGSAMGNSMGQFLSGAGGLAMGYGANQNSGGGMVNTPAGMQYGGQMGYAGTSYGSQPMLY